MNAKALSFDDEELERLIKAAESARVEFKETLGGRARDRIREAICAFANDLPCTSPVMKSRFDQSVLGATMMMITSMAGLPSMFATMAIARAASN